MFSNLHGFVEFMGNKEIYRVIRRDGLNFVSLHFKIMTSDKYDVNYI